MATATSPWSSGVTVSSVTSEIATSIIRAGGSVSDLYNREPDLAVSLAAILIQNTTPDSGILLVDMLNESGKVKGRSASSKTKEEDIAVEGDESYPRPNGDIYYSRKWGDHIDVTVIRKAREHNKTVLAYGAPGCGKTALFDAALTDLYTIMGTGDTETADFIGSYVQTPKGGFEWVDGPLVRAMEEGAALLIDEIGLIDPKVMSIVYSVMDGRKELVITANPERAVVKAKDGFYIVAATNPNAPGVRLSEALLSRFTLHVEMTTDWNLARKLGCGSAIVGAAQNLAKRQEKGDISWAPQFRELLAYRDTAKIFGQKFAVQNLIASAPEIDRGEVMQTLSKLMGEEYTPAVI
jgi:nitric oxide reductase NorQ protein